MARAKAKQQQERVEIARNALIRLRSGRAFRRRDLFDHPDYDVPVDARWVTTLIVRMREQGIVRSVVSPGKNFSEYSAVDPESLERFLSDDAQVSKLLWPSTAVLEDLQTELVAAEQGPTAVDQGSSAETAPDAGEGDVSGLTIKLLGAMLENTIFLREQMAAMEAKVNAWDPLIKDMVQTLNLLK